MKAVLQYRASPWLRERLAALDLNTVVVAETDRARSSEKYAMPMCCCTYSSQ